jgi:hypothetical protein
MLQQINHPRGWTRKDIEQDASWVVRLTAAQIADFEQALAAAESTGKALLDMEPSDFPFGFDALAVLRAAIGETQIGRGFQLLRGFPVHRWTTEQARLLYWGIGLHLGVPRPQGKASNFMADVRDAGVEYRSVTGRGHSSKAALDFHSDGSDVVTLMVLKSAKAGGQSLVASSIAAYNKMLQTAPHLAKELFGMFTFSRQGEEAPEELPHYEASILGFRDGRFACRHIRNHIASAQQAFSEVPRLTPGQIEAMDLFDELLCSEELCFEMDFEAGDLQLLNNHIVLHARTDYQDYEEEDRKRHLLRLWISLPNGQALPETWRTAYKDVDSGAVRGGFRGTSITPEIKAFEERLAQAHRVAFRVYQGVQEKAVAASQAT